MTYSTLIRAEDEKTSDVIRDIVDKVKRDDIKQEIYVYAPSILQISPELASKVRIIPASRLPMKEVFMVLLSMDTFRSSEMFDGIPDDMVIIVPDCDRYLRSVSVELVQTVLDQLVYQGARMYFISNGDMEAKDLAINRLEFEKIDTV